MSIDGDLAVKNCQVSIKELDELARVINELKYMSAVAGGKVDDVIPNGKTMRSLTNQTFRLLSKSTIEKILSNALN